MKNKSGVGNLRGQKISVDVELGDLIVCATFSLPRSRFLGCHATLQKKRLLTSALHSFLIVLAVCLRSFEQTNHVKMGLTDLRDSRCELVVFIKAFLVLRLQACL